MRMHLQGMMAAGLLAALLGSGQPAAAQAPGEPPPVPVDPDTPPAPDGMQVQPGGPLHEAFAQPPDQRPQPGPVVPRRPPPPIPEEPPAVRPEGDNVQWVPGYWAWDATRSDFTWVSGVWRLPPPGRQWVPGSWGEADGGWRWVSGFWASAGQGDMPYLPEPPASLDNGPSAPPPNAGSFYVPGCWVPQTTGWAWQPGYWSAYRPGYVWQPASYQPTPRGYLYVNGYWDYPVANRGLPFAPVAFQRPLWQTPGWSYRPSWYLPPGGLLSALFVGPGGGYYFGNYYGTGYSRRGFRPWYAGNGAAPLAGYYRRHYPGWYGGVVRTYQAARPSLPAVRPLAASGVAGLRLTPLNRGQVRQQQNLALRYRQSSVYRQTAPLRASSGPGRGALSITRFPTVAPNRTPRPGGVNRSYSPAPVRPLQAPARQTLPRYLPHQAAPQAPHRAHFTAPAVQPHAVRPAFHAAPAHHGAAGHHGHHR